MMKTEMTHEGLPKWRLYANFLIREVARMWYGQKSVFDLSKGYGPDSPFWREFVAIFDEMVKLFGKEHGLTEEVMYDRLWEANWNWQMWHGDGPTFSQPYFEAKWKAKHRLGDELYKKLLDDFDVEVSLSLIGYASGFARNGKKQPYKDIVRIRPIADYEALPVDPELEDRYYNGDALPF
jgi:hypothetical protein